MALEFHCMQKRNLTPVTVQRLFLQMASVKIPREASSIREHLTMNIIWLHLICDTLKAILWLCRVLEMLCCFTESFVAWREGSLRPFVGAISNVGRVIAASVRVC